MSRHTFELTFNGETGMLLLEILECYLADETRRQLGGETETSQEAIAYAKHLSGELHAAMVGDS